MFGITTPPTRSDSSSGRNTHNKLEEVRVGTSRSGSYDAGAAERMKMDYLKKERERREKERNKLTYDSKRREYDSLLQSVDRIKSENRRLEMELSRYEQDSAHAHSEEQKVSTTLTSQKREMESLEIQIKKLEADLQMCKNRHQRLVQDVSKLEQQERAGAMDAKKKEDYVRGLKTKIDTAKKRLIEYERDMETAHKETEALKRII